MIFCNLRKQKIGTEQEQLSTYISLTFYARYMHKGIKRRSYCFCSFYIKGGHSHSKISFNTISCLIWQIIKPCWWTTEAFLILFPIFFFFFFYILPSRFIRDAKKNHPLLLVKHHASYLYLLAISKHIFLPFFSYDCIKWPNKAEVDFFFVCVCRGGSSTTIIDTNFLVVLLHKYKGSICWKYTFIALFIN